MPFNRNEHYHGLLLRQVPTGCQAALDVGCGHGLLARRLAELVAEVDAVDSCAEVIQAASVGRGVRWRHADITAMPLTPGRYGYISCVAAIHHVPFETVTRLRLALAPGGVLAILGLARPRSPLDWAVGVATAPPNVAARLAVAGVERMRGKSWHAKMTAPVRDPEMTVAEIRRRARRLLPGSTVRRLLFWRYLLLYRQPAAD